MSADAELTPRPAEIPGWDEMDEAAQAGAGAPDGGVRRVPRAHRLPRRPADRCGRGARRSREHARLLHHRRQRSLGRGHPERRLQRDGELQRHVRDRDAGVHGQRQGQARNDGGLQPLRGRLVVGDLHPVPVDEAGRFALGRHPQRHDRPLARRHQEQGRDPEPVHPRDRRGADDPRGSRPARACLRQRGAAGADRGHEHGLQLRPGRRAGAARPPVLRDGRKPRHLPQGLERRHPPQHALAAEPGASRRSTTTSGSSTTATTTGRRPTTWRPTIPSGSRPCNGSG